jgi:electron transfer flavoprotein-quinone oxidoreductase
MTGDAAGLALNSLYTVRGMDFALASGYYAAQATIRARKDGDVSAAGPAYDQMMRGSWVIKDLETAAGVPDFIENPRVFTHYPQSVQRLFEQVFTLSNQPADKISKKVYGSVKKDFMNLTTMKELLGMRKI